MRKYEVHEKLGEGGFGEVYRAVRLADGLEVAIKFLHEGAGAEERHRFEREVRLILGQQHPNVIKLLDHDLTAARPYYVMPFMRGGTLTRWVGRLSHDSVRNVFRCLVDVVLYLHENGGIHRDMKPDNILIDGDGNIAVGDFGHGNNPQFTVMFTVNGFGTQGYAAPELFQRGGLASAASDIYSLGATIFHLVTGVHPFKAGILDLRRHAPDAPADLDQIVKKMVAREPTQRPTIQELAELLGIRVRQPQVTVTTAPSGGFTPRHSPTKVGGGRYG